MNMRLISVLMLGLAFLLCALSTGAQVYYLVAFSLFILIALSFVAAVWALATTTVDMKGLRGRVERGESMMTIFTVRHKSLLPVSAVRIRLSVPSAFSPNQEISVSAPPFTNKVYRYRLVCPHRGEFEAGITRILAGDLFGLITLSKKSDIKLRRVDVVPKVPRDMAMELQNGDMGPETVNSAAEDASSPSDVRKYIEGDSLKKVHWKLSMRKREVMVKVYEESARPDTLIIPDLTNVSALRDQALTIEDCVCEACAGAVKAQLDAGYPARMPLMCSSPSEVAGQFPSDTGRFLDALMRVKFDSPYEYEQVISLMLQRASRTGGAVIVTPRLTTRIADLAARMQQSGVRTRVIWITDTRLDQSLEMSERLKMENVQVDRVDPWDDGEIDNR